MEKLPRIHVLTRAARSAPSLRTPAHGPRSILSVAAGSYGARPAEDTTIPTGFDPVAVVLFEAIVEGAYLVASADGRFDDEERKAFERVVVEACGGAVSSQQVTALVGELDSRMQAEGLERRVAAVAAGVSKKEHAQEVLRVAAVIAQVSDGGSAVEQEVLGKIAARCGLDALHVRAALADAERALADAPSP